MHCDLAGHHQHAHDRPSWARLRDRCNDAVPCGRKRRRSQTPNTQEAPPPLMPSCPWDSNS
eukprot:4906724-Alexandrium_andersonii.AAC.1